MVKFSKRVIILSAFVVAALDGRRLKNNKNSKNNKIKPCNKNKNKPEQEVVGSVGREVEIVHEIQRTTSSPSRRVTLGNPDDFRSKIGALRHYVDFQDFWDDYMYRRYDHAYDALTDPWYTNSQPLIEDDYFLHEPYFMYCDRVRGPGIRRDIKLSHQELITCANEVNRKRNYKEASVHRARLAGDSTGDGWLNKEEFTRLEMVKLRALASASLEIFDIDNSNYIEPRGSEKNAFCKAWSFIFEYPISKIFDIWKGADEDKNDALDKFELYTFHAGLFNDFLQNVVIDNSPTPLDIRVESIELYEAK